MTLDMAVQFHRNYGVGSNYFDTDDVDAPCDVRYLRR